MRCQKWATAESRGKIYTVKTTSYIAFLRAINVGGRVVKMERLREIFRQLGLEDVRTYIQSGNVFFSSNEEDRAGLTSRIEAHLQQALGYEVPVMLRTIAEVEATLALDPFRDVEVTDEVRLCVAFISGPMPKTLQLPHTSPKGEIEILTATDGEVFVVARQQAGRPGNPGAYIEKTFKVKATVRFWGTTAKILEAAKTNKTEGQDKS